MNRSKKKEAGKSGLSISINTCQPNGSTDQSTVTSRAIGQDRWIQHLTTRRTLPGIKRAYKNIVFFRIHAAFTFWTLHF